MTNIALESNIEKLMIDLQHSHLMSDVLVDLIQEEIARLQDQLDYENHNGANPHFAVLDELNTIDPIIFKVSQQEWEYLNKALNEPPKENRGLRRLFGKHEGKDND
jgi:hypothetical protein